MRYILIIALFTVASCKQKTVDTAALTKSIWVNADIKFDTSWFEWNSYILHGSGTLLRFDTVQTFKSLTNEFYLANDTIAWGEPLADFQLGKWIIEGDKIITTNTYIDGSAVELLGKQTVDTFSLVGDTLLLNNKEKYVSAKPLTAELTDIFNKSWPSYNKKNGK